MISLMLSDRLTQTRWRPAIVVGLLALHAAIADLSLRHKSLTYDEHRHFLQGVRNLSGDFRCVDDSKMPVSMLNALPYCPAIVSSPDPAKDFRADPRPGRLVTILFSVLLGALVYRWSSALYGFAGGLLSLTLYVFSPSLLAHGRLVTTDLYAAFTATLAAYTYWRLMSVPRVRNAMLAGFALGLAQIAKFSAVLLVPAFLAVAAVRLAPEVVQALRRREFARLGRGVLEAGRLTGVIVVIALTTLNAGYGFTGTGTPLGDYSFRSEAFLDLQSRLDAVAGFPVPFPRPYLEGLDWVKHVDATRDDLAPSYLLGERRIGRFVAYYPLVLLFKVPIGAQIIVLLALWGFLRRFSSFRFHRDEAFLILPLLAYGFHFTFFCNTQIGVRLVLMILPLLHVFCGGLLRDLNAVGARVRWGVGLSLIYMVVSVLSYAPHFISYFNELVPDRKTSWRVLADSNLDWGQNREYVERYLRDHPGTHLNPHTPVSGPVLISANLLVGISVPPADYAICKWIRENLEPTDHVAYSHLVFEVPPRAGEEVGRGEAASTSAPE
jgi:hypothetical protein